MAIEFLLLYSKRQKEASKDGVWHLLKSDVQHTTCYRLLCRTGQSRQFISIHFDLLTAFYFFFFPEKYFQLQIPGIQGIGELQRAKTLRLWPKVFRRGWSIFTTSENGIIFVLTDT